jgi:Protein of unknown function (DUF2846)
MTRFAPIVAFLFFFTGCSIPGPLFFPETPFATQPVPADKARIIFLRPRDAYLGAPSARVEIDGATVGKLARGEFLVIDTDPGEREISVADGDAKSRFALKLSVEAQQIYDLQVGRRDEDRKYEATGILGWLAERVIPSATDDRGPFILERVSPWVVLGMLATLAASNEK